MKKNSKKINILRKEIISNNKPLHSINEIKKWYFNIIKKSNVKVRKIDLNKCIDWKFSKKKIKLKEAVDYIVEARDMFAFDQLEKEEQGSKKELKSRQIGQPCQTGRQCCR